MHAILTVFAKEFRENLRERRTLISALILGPLLGPALFSGLLALQIHRSAEAGDRPLALTVAHAERAPNLLAFLKSAGVTPTEASYGGGRGARQAVARSRTPARAGTSARSSPRIWPPARPRRWSCTPTPPTSRRPPTPSACARCSSSTPGNSHACAWWPAARIRCCSTPSPCRTSTCRHRLDALRAGAGHAQLPAVDHHADGRHVPGDRAPRPGSASAARSSRCSPCRCRAPS